MGLRSAGWLLGLAGLVAAGPAAAARYTQPGLYSINPEGWRHGSTPLGEVFLCEGCSSRVQVQISYGSKLPGGKAVSGNAEFLGRLDDEDKQRQFADLMMQQALPPDTDLSYEIQAVRKVHIGGLDAFEYVAVIQTQPQASREDAMIAVHKGRLMKLTLNFYDEAMDEDAARRVSVLLKSLKFF